jgi:DNA-binding transcriptional MerR regulator
MATDAMNAIQCLMKMRDLEQQSGVGRETIRYYIREGLLPEPERRARNVAVYGAPHVQRLKTIKRLQEERFLPLDIIRRVLDGDPTALPAASTPFPELAPLLAERLGLAAAEPLTPLNAILDGDPLLEADVAIFASLGIIHPILSAGERMVSRLDARLLATWRDIRSAGYTPADFPAASIANYADAMSALAKTEVASFFEAFQGRLSQSDAAARAQSGVELLNTLIATLRIRAILDEVLKRSPTKPRDRRPRTRSSSPARGG